MASVREGKAYGSARAATKVEDFSWFAVLDLLHDPFYRFDLWSEICECCFGGWTDRVEELFGCHGVVGRGAGRSYFNRSHGEEPGRQMLVNQRKAMARTVLMRCDSV